MKRMIQLMTCAVVATMSMEVAKAALNIPSDGSDGALVISSDTVIDLSQARTANWDANNNGYGGVGIYDSNKWAVVFKYSSVTVQGGATVTFKNHTTCAPVVWLVQSNVTINGIVDVSGQDFPSAPDLAVPGPGGFRGGSGIIGGGINQGSGFGVGGGQKGDGFMQKAAGGGSYGSVGANGLAPYGNPSLIPLIGGSGGGGAPNSAGGGAGGGAILIACGRQMTITGTVKAKGGDCYRTSDWNDGSAGGSGGGIRLVADELNGNGTNAAPGGLPVSSNRGMNGGVGRIRIERVTVGGNLQVYPDPSVLNLAAGATPLIWPPVNGPTVRIVSVGGNVAPADPRAGFGAIGPDVVLPTVTSTTVVVETTNVEQASVVTVRATPRANGEFSESTNAVPQVVTEDPLVIRWTVNVPVQEGYSAVQVKVVRP